MEELADATLGDFNFAVYPVGREIDKVSGKLGQERLKLQHFLQRLF